MKLIHVFCCKHDQNNDKYYAVFSSLQALFINFQKMINQYLKEFHGWMATLDDYNANVVDLVPCLVENALKELNNMTMDLANKREIKKARDYVLKRGPATLLLIGADHRRYGAMKNQTQKTW